MANRAPLLNNLLLLLGLLLSLLSYRKQTDQTSTIPTLFVTDSESGWQRRDGKLWLNNKPFSGWKYQLWPCGDTAFVGAFYEGKAEEFHRHWYENHQQKEVRHFRNGWQEGEQRGWFDSGKPAFVYHFQNDMYEGNCKEWYASGRPAQDKNYRTGQESGSQRMWYAEGNLKANYVVRSGRTYGFTGVKNCVNVWDSIDVTH